MELLHKHTKSTPKLRFNATMPSTHSRENWAFSWEKLSRFDPCVLSFTCVHGVAALVFLCVFLLPPYSCALIEIICVRHERLQLVEIPHKGIWYKEEQCGTQVWYLDDLRGVECNPWPKEVTTTWSRHWPNHGIKSPCLLCIFCIVILIFQEFSYFTCIVVPKFNTHIQGTINSRVLFSSPPLLITTWF
jgi:hypothetical protein